MENGDGLREQLAALHSISVEIAGLHELSEIYDRALGYCLELTGSEFAFTGLLRDSNVGIVVRGRTETREPVMDVAAIKGFEPSSRAFYERFHLMAVRSSVVGVVLREARANISNDVAGDPRSVGQPPGHPPIRKFLGVPLLVGGTVIGMIGVANKPAGYGPDDEALLSTFANEVAVAVDNARLYERQRETITELRRLHERLTDVERAQLLARERDRIAGALHDGIEQRIFTIGIRVNTLLEAGVAERTSDEELVEIRQLAIKASDEVRKVIFALAVPGQGNTDLTSDIRSMLRDLEGGSGLHTHLAVSGDATPAVEAVHDVVRSLVNEALTNIRKHANARMVLVSVRYEEDRLDVVIQDDGDGAPDSVLGSFQDSYLHFGLRHMRQQTLERGGTFEVANGDETGLVLRISIPVPKGPT